MVVGGWQWDLSVDLQIPEPGGMGTWGVVAGPWGSAGAGLPVAGSGQKRQQVMGRGFLLEGGPY